MLLFVSLLNTIIKLNYIYHTFFYYLDGTYAKIKIFSRPDNLTGNLTENLSDPLTDTYREKPDCFL